MISTTQLTEKVQGMLMGVLLGDALGQPVETMSHETIMQMNEGRGVEGFMDSIPGTKRFNNNSKAGDFTDDWELTDVVGQSLVRTGLAFDIEDCAQGHVHAFRDVSHTWGKTTMIAIRDIKNGTRNVKSQPLEPIHHNTHLGSGNGIIMKVSPFAVALLRGNSTHRDVWDMGGITHSNPLASATASAIVEVLRVLLASDEKKLHFHSVEILAVLEDFFLGEVPRAKSGEQRAAVEEVRELTRYIFSIYNDATLLRELPHHKFSAMYTYGFALGTYLRHPRDFRAGVLEAVNAGGDTDSNACVVGALIGATVGIDVIPYEWRTFRLEYVVATQLADALVEKTLPIV